ncbi:MAG: hypothetical protein LBP98_05120 [Tannerella sp.]|jgi:hypothetical protein|nr:hypothetical protein [Tannerella sp.]
MTKKRQYLSALLIIAITGIGFVTVSGSVFSGYHFMDCHGFTNIAWTVRETSWWESLKSFFLSESGRFRPGWCLYMHLVSCMPWGDNMLAQGIVKILLNILAAFILYVTGRNMKWPHRSSLLFAGLTVIGTQSAIFYQTVSQETTGLIFLSLSWLLLLKLVNRGGGDFIFV